MPLVGTWIEIKNVLQYANSNSSCPSWARGLKLSVFTNRFEAGVVPLVGTWIEIVSGISIYIFLMSCPSWARGLKFRWMDRMRMSRVVPLVGTWIEMICAKQSPQMICRAPRGHVD